MLLGLNETAPDNTAASTLGGSHFQDRFNENRALLFSHPMDLTRVRTTSSGTAYEFVKDLAQELMGRNPV